LSPSLYHIAIAIPFHSHINLDAASVELIGKREYVVDRVPTNPELVQNEVLLVEEF
jgi:hypothetical protein